MIDCKLTEIEKKMLAAVREVFGWTDRPSLEAMHQTVKPELMDWQYCSGRGNNGIPKGEWIYLSTPFLRPNQIANMQAELKEGIDRGMKAQGVQARKCQFFPTTYWKGYIFNGPRIYTSWNSVSFLRQKSVRIDLDPIFEKYYLIQKKYSSDLQVCSQRMNVASGYPIWSNFNYVNSGQTPHLRLRVPESGDCSPYQEFNSGPQITAFIKDHNLESVMRYDELHHRDGADATLLIEGRDLSAIQNAVTRIEAVGEPFRDVIAGMLLRASSSVVFGSLVYQESLECLKEQSPCSVEVLIDRMRKGPIRKDLLSVLNLADDSIKTEQMLAELITFSKEGKREASLALQKIMGYIPALEPFIQSRLIDPQPAGRGMINNVVEKYSP